MQPVFTTDLGSIFHQDSVDLMSAMPDESVNLIMTSPPFGLIRQKSYGNVESDDYLDWFRQFAVHFKRILKDNGSLVIDIGGAWVKGQPTRSLYHYELMIMLCKEYGFHLAQEFFWWNPAKLPTPAEWVTIRRLRVKDGVNCVWWLSKKPWPKANNRRVLVPYSQSMRGLIQNGAPAKKRPSGHNVSDNFQVDNGAAIPSNLIAIANTESNSHYLLKCKAADIKPHPARFPSALPEYFIRMLTDKDDLVFDPFGGSCVTGEASERLGRRWVCAELDSLYVDGAKLRFPVLPVKPSTVTYGISHPSALWGGEEVPAILSQDGGFKKPKKDIKILDA